MNTGCFISLFFLGLWLSAVVSRDHRRYNAVKDKVRVKTWLCGTGHTYHFTATTEWYETVFKTLPGVTRVPYRGHKPIEHLLVPGFDYKVMYSKQALVASLHPLWQDSTELCVFIQDDFFDFNIFGKAVMPWYVWPLTVPFKMLIVLNDVLLWTGVFPVHE